MLPKLTCSICLKGVSKITSRDNKYLRIEVQYSLYYFLVFDSEIRIFGADVYNGLQHV